MGTLINDWNKKLKSKLDNIFKFNQNLKTLIKNFSLENWIKKLKIYKNLKISIENSNLKNNINEKLNSKQDNYV